MKHFLPLLACLVLCTSCETASVLTSSHNMSASGQTGVVNDDRIVVSTEQALNIALDTFDQFLKLERENPEMFQRFSGNRAHAWAENIRRNGEKWIDSAEAAKDVYKRSRNSLNHANLVTAYKTLQEAITQSKTYIAGGTQ